MVEGKTVIKFDSRTEGTKALIDAWKSIVLELELSFGEWFEYLPNPI